MSDTPRQAGRREWWQDAFTKGWYPLPNLVAQKAWQKKTREEVHKLRQLLNITRSSRILDVACGTGRHSLVLARSGCEVVGVDVSPKYLNVARRNAKSQSSSARFVRQDMRRMRFRQEFDVALNLFSSFGYFTKPADDLRVLRNIYNALKPGGRFLLDIFNAGWLRAHFTPQSWGELSDGTLVLESRRLDEKRKVAITRWIFVSKGKRREMTSSIRLYTARDLIRLFNEAGFKKVRALGDLSGRRYLLTQSPRLVVVAERPKETRKRG